MDGINISFLLLAVCIALSNQFLLCYFGKLATESFDAMSECLYNCNWNELPLSFQRDLIIIMENTQQPIYYHGFGIANLNLQTFCKVIMFLLICEQALLKSSLKSRFDWLLFSFCEPYTLTSCYSRQWRTNNGTTGSRRFCIRTETISLQSKTSGLDASGKFIYPMLWKISDKYTLFE